MWRVVPCHSFWSSPFQGKVGIIQEERQEQRLLVLPLMRSSACVLMYTYSTHSAQVKAAETSDRCAWKLETTTMTARHNGRKGRKKRPSPAVNPQGSIYIIYAKQEDPCHHHAGVEAHPVVGVEVDFLAEDTPKILCGTVWKRQPRPCMTTVWNCWRDNQ